MMLRRKHGMRVVQVYSTYGDGGQNAIGREIGPALARIRVRETLRAAAMSGAEVRWLGMPDFGFSKTREETLKFWGAEEFKDRMRRVFDEVDPDVVITNHSLDKGHGHHRASIWAAIELLKERERDGRYVPRLYPRSGVDKAQLAFDPASWTQRAATPTRGWRGTRGRSTRARARGASAAAARRQRLLAGGLSRGCRRDGRRGPRGWRGRWGRSGHGVAERLPHVSARPRWREAAVVRRTLIEQADKSSRRRWSQVWRRRADALQRLMLALKGVRRGLAGA